MVLLENVSMVEVAVVIEMIVDQDMGGGELLQGLYVPELRHRTLLPTAATADNGCTSSLPGSPNRTAEWRGGEKFRTKVDLTK